MSSETKWTPGPWQWETTGGASRLRPVANLGTTPEFDGCDPIMDDGSAGGEYQRTIEPESANGHLIAAAPELYEAVWAILKHQTPINLDLWKAGYDALLKAHNGNESEINAREIRERAEEAKARGDGAEGSTKESKKQPGICKPCTMGDHEKCYGEGRLNRCVCIHAEGGTKDAQQ